MSLMVLVFAEQYTDKG